MTGRLQSIPPWLVVLLPLAGCEPAPTVPDDIPPTPASSGAASTDPASRARYRQVAFVEPAEAFKPYRIWELVGRGEAGNRRASFRGYRTAAMGTPAAQAALIRKAVDDGASALVVVPMDGPEVAGALDEAKAAGVPAVLIGREGPPGSKAPTVRVTGEREVADRLVAAAVEDAKLQKYPIGVAGLLVDPEGGDDRRPARLQALRDAAAAAGLTALVEVPIGGGSMPIATALLANPGLSIFLAESDPCLSAAVDAREDLDLRATYVVAGFGSSSNMAQLAMIGSASAVAVADISTLMRTAVRTALDLSDGVATPPSTDPLWSFSRGVTQPPGRHFTKSGLPPEVKGPR